MNAEVKFNPPTYPNLEATLASVGWNYRDFGKYLNVSDDSISKKMRGIIEFKLDELVSSSQLFDKPIEWLFFKGQCE